MLTFPTRAVGIESEMKMSKNQDFPTTIDTAVRLLMGLMPEEEQTKIAYLSESYLPTLHIGLGQWIRNNMGLWKDNPALLEATGQSDPDDASTVIITALWHRLREELPRVH